MDFVQQQVVAAHHALPEVVVASPDDQAPNRQQPEDPGVGFASGRNPVEGDQEASRGQTHKPAHGGANQQPAQEK